MKDRPRASASCVLARSGVIFNQRVVLVMKLLRSVFLVSSLFSLSLFAQHGGGGHGGGGGGFRGGGGGGGAIRGGGGFGGGGFRGGYGGYGYGYRGFGYGFGLGFGLGWPYYGYGYGYPYYGGYSPYYYNPYYYDYGYAAPPAYTYAPAAPAPTYTAPAAPAASGSYYRPADYYLIAFNDHNIRAAQSYQVIGDQIEWMPKEGGPVQRAPLSTVDKAFSTQINRDRRVQFTLP